MSRKTNFDELVAKSAGPKSLKERLEHAKKVLEQRPTGFTEPQAPAETHAPTGQASASAPTKSASKVAAKSPEAPVMSLPGSVSSRLGTPAYMEVPLELIDDNPYNARQFYLPERVAELSASMAADGQLVPGLAVKRAGRFILIGAHYRKKAAAQAKIPVLKLMVYDNVSDQDLYLLSYKENAERNEQTPVDNAFAWKRVLDDGVYESEVKLAEAIGQSKSNVNKTLSITKLEPAVMDVVGQHPNDFPLSVLYELYLLQKDCDSLVAAQVAIRVVQEGIGRKEVAAARERALAQKEQGGRRKYVSSRMYRLSNGQVRDWDSGRVLVDITVEDESARKAFLEYVRQQFKAEEK